MKSLKVKIAVFCTIIVFIVNAIFATANYYVQKKELLHKLDQSIAGILANTTNNITIPLYNLDNESMEKVIRTALSYEELTAVTVRADNRETVIIGKARNQQDHIVNFTSSNDEYYQIKTSEIVYKERIIGYLDCYFSDELVREQINLNTQNIIIMNLVVFFMLIIGIILFLQITVIRPLNKIMHIFDALPAEISGITGRLDKQSEPDEIKLLANLTAVITAEINKSYSTLKESERKNTAIFLIICLMRLPTPIIQIS